MQSNWSDEVEVNRREKDSFFGSDADSPIPHEERHRFTGLKYFPPDPKYVIKTKLHRYENPELVVMATSKGTKDWYNRVGYFEFEIDEKKVILQAYTPAEKGDNGLFIPFRDQTSGKESYDAARYLDLGRRPGDEYTLDFNHAYNPYCAYSDDYICPLPPKENWLDIEIRAGEKKYHE